MGDDYDEEDDDSTAHNFADKSCKSGNWYTPEKVLDQVRVYYRGEIPLDPCTIESNPTRARVYYTPETDGLKWDWSDMGGVFINPPYGVKNRFHEWVEKIHEEAEGGTEIIALLPCGSRFETRYWQENILSEYLDAVCFIRGRLKFIDEHGVEGKSNVYGSMLYMYNGDMHRFVEAFWDLGRIFSMKLM